MKNVLLFLSLAILVISCQIDEPPGSLIIASDIDGAYVYVDTVKQGSSTASASSLLIELNAGTYEIYAFKTGYAPIINSVVIKSETTTNLSLSFVATTSVYSDDFEVNVLSVTTATEVDATMETDGSNSYLKLAIPDTSVRTVNDAIFYAGTLTNFTYECTIINSNTSPINLTIKNDTTGAHFTFGEDVIGWEVIADAAATYIAEVNHDPDLSYTEKVVRVSVIDSTIFFFVDDEYICSFDDTHSTLVNAPFTIGIFHEYIPAIGSIFLGVDDVLVESF